MAIFNATLRKFSIFRLNFNNFNEIGNYLCTTFTKTHLIIVNGFLKRPFENHLSGCLSFFANFNCTMRLHRWWDISVLFFLSWHLFLNMNLLHVGSLWLISSSFLFFFSFLTILQFWAFFLIIIGSKRWNQSFPRKKRKKNSVIHVSLNKCIFCKYPCQIFISFDVIMCLTLIWCCHSMFVRRLYFGNVMKYFVLPNIIVCLKRTGEKEKYLHLSQRYFSISIATHTHARKLYNGQTIVKYS